MEHGWQWAEGDEKKPRRRRQAAYTINSYKRDMRAGEVYWLSSLSWRDYITRKFGYWPEEPAETQEEERRAA